MLLLHHCSQKISFGWVLKPAVVFQRVSWSTAISTGAFACPSCRNSRRSAIKAMCEWLSSSRGYCFGPCWQCWQVCSCGQWDHKWITLMTKYNAHWFRVWARNSIEHTRKILEEWARKKKAAAWAQEHWWSGLGGGVGGLVAQWWPGVCEKFVHVCVQHAVFANSYASNIKISTLKSE